MVSLVTPELNGIEEYVTVINLYRNMVTTVSISYLFFAQQFTLHNDNHKIQHTQYFLAVVEKNLSKS